MKVLESQKVTEEKVISTINKIKAETGLTYFVCKETIDNCCVPQIIKEVFTVYKERFLEKPWIVGHCNTIDEVFQLLDLKLNEFFYIKKAEELTNELKQNGIYFEKGNPFTINARYTDIIYNEYRYNSFLSYQLYDSIRLGDFKYLEYFFMYIKEFVKYIKEKESNVKCNYSSAFGIEYDFDKLFYKKHHKYYFYKVQYKKSL